MRTSLYSRRLLVRGLVSFLLMICIFLVVQVGAGSQSDQNQNGDQKEPKQKNTESKGKDGSGTAPAASTVQPLKGLTDTEAESVFQSLLQRAYFSMGYQSVQADPSPKYRKLDLYRRLEKETEDTTRILHAGLKHYPPRDTDLILRGKRKIEGQTRTGNPDVKTLTSFLEQERKQVKKKDKTYALDELKIKFYQLSSILPEQSLKILNSLGYNTSKPKAGKKIPYKKLPVVYRTPENEQPIVVSNETNKKLNTSTQSAPRNRLIILYHPSQRDQLVRLTNLLKNKVDVISRQVLIESLVVELTEEGRRELGVEWEGENNRGALSGTFQTTPSGDTPMNVTGRFFTFQRGMDELQAHLRTLIKSNDAQVLSSPSVLTLNNAQARIQVIQEVPVIKTIVTEVQDIAKVDVDFKEVGITLNIKPRITSSGEEVTMQIQGEVSEAPLADFVEVNGEKVAPLVNRRKVQTIAQVNNNTPFIIGGLIRRKESTQVDRIPIISRIPLVGYLFQVRENVSERREDIIVLNPRVISPDGSKRPIKPKDSERFDFLDNKLFRNSYRLKSNDVFDLSFIEGNENIQKWLRQAREFATKNPEFKDQPPFERIQDGSIPGEKAMVVRMIYEVAKKLKLQNRIRLDNLIYFQEERDNPAGFELKFLKSVLQKAGIVESDGDFEDRSYPRNVLVLRYDVQPKQIDNITKTPAATVQIKKVSSEEEADRLWRKGNQLKGYNRPQSTIVIDSKEDLERLRTAIAVREIISVNDALLRLDQFRVGRKIVIPQIKEHNDRIFLIDQNVSRYFYQSEFYYAVLKNMLRHYHDGIRKILEKHGK